MAAAFALIALIARRLGRCSVRRAGRYRARRRADPDPGIRVRQATPLASEAAGRVGP